MSRRNSVRLNQAVVLGLVHGPAELLPISSSAHIALVPWLLRWDYGELEPELRKTFEVALHAGTAAALTIGLRDEPPNVSPRLIGVVALASAPAALAGYALERPIERRLGTPATIAAALMIGGLALAWADSKPELRASTDAGPRDALWLGVAQACALVPGVSRSGATLAAARHRRFRREDARRLSRDVALPVILGAATHKGLRLRRRPVPSAAPLALGAAASFASTLTSARIIRALELDRPLTAYALYRIALAVAVARRLTARGTTMAP